jgi:type II secretory pathway component GspD/PulD (secretin)
MERQREIERANEPGFWAREGNSDFWDLRAESFQSFDTFSVGYSQRLTDTGGLGLQYQLLGKEQLQLVLRALRKTQRAILIEEPNIVVFNNQRSHLMILRQQPYVAGYKAVTGQFAGAGWEPEIGLMNIGSLIDVKPIISNDLRYVLMELQLSQTGFLGFKPMQQLRMGITMRPQTGALDPSQYQSPQLMTQLARVTVNIPDRSTLLISGFKEIFQQEIVSETPFLSKLPIIGALFRRKSRTDERRNHIILVTPKIINLAEFEPSLKK